MLFSGAEVRAGPTERLIVSDVACLLDPSEGPSPEDSNNHLVCWIAGNAGCSCESKVRIHENR